MSALEPCPACRRHVRVSEATCPFCDAALPAFAPRAMPRGRLGRGAVFVAGAALASGAACGGSKAKADDPIGNTVIGAIDAGDEQAPPPDAAPPDAAPLPPPDDDWHHIPKPYGAPPVRGRLV